jgi:hypothetical protein
MSPHIERSQHVTPCLIYSRWIDRGHHRQVDHARSSHYLLDDCTGNYRLHHWRRRYSYVCASARSAFSYGRSYFLHVGCDPGAICLLKTQDSISARVESRGNSGVSWLLEAIDRQDSQTAPTSWTGKPRALTRWETRPHRRLGLAQFSVRSGRNNLKGHELRMRVRPRHGL